MTSKKEAGAGTDGEGEGDAKNTGILVRGSTVQDKLRPEARRIQQWKAVPPNCVSEVGKQWKQV